MKYTLPLHRGWFPAAVVLWACIGCSDGTKGPTADGNPGRAKRVTTTQFYATQFADVVKPCAEEAGMRTGAINEGSLGGGATGKHYFRMLVRNASPEKADKLMRCVRAAVEKATRGGPGGPGEPNQEALKITKASDTVNDNLLTQLQRTYLAAGGTNGELTVKMELGKTFAKEDEPGGAVVDATEPGMGVLYIELNEWVE